MCGSDDRYCNGGPVRRGTWVSIRKELATLAENRNILAHSSVGFEPAGGEHTLWNAPLLSRKFDHEETLTAQGVVELRETFRQVNVRLARFMSSFSEKKD